jgi:hypothetical protein
MSNNKQTAVDSIIEFCQKQMDNDSSIHKGVYLSIIKFCEEQAKEIETKERIKNKFELSASLANWREQTRESAMHIGFAQGFMSGIQCHEDYYEELNRTNLDEDEFTRNYIVDEFEKAYAGGNND